jgi:hypothetical protein
MLLIVASEPLASVPRRTVKLQYRKHHESRGIMWRMPRASLLLLCVLAVALIGARGQSSPAAAPKSSTPAKNSPKKAPAKTEDEPTVDRKELRLLKESYASAAALDATSRTILLEKQCIAVEDIEDLSKSWCTELFQLAKDQLSTGDFRAHAQTVAARAMSVRYPDTALAMLQAVDITDAQSDDRASVSRMVFEGVMHNRGAKGFPDLMAAASRLGETGSYPYLATTIMLYGGASPRNIEESPNTHYSDAQVDACNEVVQQGLTYFKKDSLNLKADFQFMTLLRAGAYSGCPSGWLMHQAVTDFAGEVVKMATAAINGDEKIRPRTAKMLYESADHLLQEIDPVLAESVEKNVGDVKNIPDGQPSNNSSKKSAPSNAWMSDPDARALFEKVAESESVLNTGSDTPGPHTSQMEIAIREAFSAAQKLVQKVEDVDPDAAVALRRGGGNMTAFVTTAMRAWPDATIEQIEAMPDGEFKAHLLLAAADGVARNREEQHLLHRRLR